MGQRNPNHQLKTVDFTSHLVGGFNHLEKSEFVNGKDYIPYMKWKIKAMFQTTNIPLFKSAFNHLTGGLLDFASSSPGPSGIHGGPHLSS